MRLLLLGPPSSGKGTIGEMLSERLNIPLIGMGSILRSLPQTHPRYEEVDKIMDSGGLAPNELVSGLLNERLQHPDCANGYIIDGYPRDPDQLALYEPQIDKAILLLVSIDSIFRRVTGRRICTSDNKPYNIYTLPEEELKKCTGELIQRDDDTEEALTKRLEIYLNKSVKVSDYYRKKGILYEVSAEPLPQEIVESIEKLLND